MVGKRFSTVHHLEKGLADAQRKGRMPDTERLLNVQRRLQVMNAAVIAKGADDSVSRFFLMAGGQVVLLVRIARAEIKGFVADAPLQLVRRGRKQQRITPLVHELVAVIDGVAQLAERRARGARRERQRLAPAVTLVADA